MADKLVSNVLFAWIEFKKIDYYKNSEKGYDT